MFVSLPTDGLQAVVVEADVSLRDAVDERLAGEVTEGAHDLAASVPLVQHLHLGPRVVVHEADEGLCERLEVGGAGARQERVDGLTPGEEVEGHGTHGHHRHVPEADLARHGRRGVVAHGAEEDASAALHEEVDRLVHAGRLRALRVLVVDVQVARRQEPVGVDALDGDGRGRTYLADGEEARRVLGQDGRDHRLAVVAGRSPLAQREDGHDAVQPRAQHCHCIHLMLGRVWRTSRRRWVDFVVLARVSTTV